MPEQRRAWEDTAPLSSFEVDGKINWPRAHVATVHLLGPKGLQTADRTTIRRKAIGREEGRDRTRTHAEDEINAYLKRGHRAHHGLMEEESRKGNCTFRSKLSNTIHCHYAIF